MQNQGVYQPPFLQNDIHEIDSSYTHSQFIKMLQNQQFNRGLGCIFGACLGDALGSYCQFQRDIIGVQKMNKTMKMEGGGPFHTHPGQFTDDSQLALHLITGLHSYKKQIKLQDQINIITRSIALEYVKWLDSQPFDAGMTCSTGINLIYKNGLMKHQKESNQQLQKYLGKIYQDISVANSTSQSNGSLMRITPMAFFISLVGDSSAAQSLAQSNLENIIEQIKLTHSQDTVVMAGKIWVKLLTKLINRKSNQKQQFMHIREQVTQMGKGTLDDWIHQSEKQQLMPAVQNIGWAKIAWSMGFNLMKKITLKGITQNTYENTMKEVIQCGGDTDTNAAIVGGLVGSIVGFKKLPPIYLKKALSLRFSNQNQNGVNRTTFYEPRRMLAKAIQLFKMIK